MRYIMVYHASGRVTDDFPGSAKSRKEKAHPVLGGHEDNAEAPICVPSTPSTGFVPSLEAMPLLALSKGEVIWRMQPCPSYGRIIRHLLTGELAAGLLPWELGITELVTKPAQKGVWSVPLVLHACPTELVLSAKAARLVQPAKGQKKSDSKRLVFGIEGRCSLTRYQILAWQLQVAKKHLDPPAFKVLPMELMRKGLEAGTLDGMVAPTPWGMQAEAEGNGKLDARFEPGKYAQQLVLFCRKDLAADHEEVFAALPSELAAMHERLEDEGEFQKVADQMAKLGTPRCDPTRLREAAERHLVGIQQKDFQPDKGWLAAELQLLAERVPLGEGTFHVDELAAALAPQRATYEATASSSS